MTITASARPVATRTASLAGDGALPVPAERYTSFTSMFETSDATAMAKVIGVLSASALTLSVGVSASTLESDSSSLPNVELGIERLASLFELSAVTDSVDYLFERALPEAMPTQLFEEFDQFTSVESKFDLPWG